MKKPGVKSFRCAIYTRVSTDAGLEQDFNSLDAQREASEAYIQSQAHEGWQLIKNGYDDGGFSGGSLERPAIKNLLADVKAGLIDIVLVYKVDRLTRSLADFAKLVEMFDTHGVSFVSVTQAFNTTNSMGRLTLNVLLSFAQFEREVTGERIRDKIAASKKKGIWLGGGVPLGYRIQDRKLLVDPDESATVKLMFERYLALESMPLLLTELRERGIKTRVRSCGIDQTVGGVPFTLGPLAYLLRNRTYRGEVCHKGAVYPGEHEPLFDTELFDAVQVKLAQNRVHSHASLESSRALLMGKIFDDRGNIMKPAHSRKNGLRYPYYISRALVEGRKAEAGTIHRVAAQDIEPKIIEALKACSFKMLAPLEVDGTDSNKDVAHILIGSMVARIVIETSQIVIDLQEGTGAPLDKPRICIPWNRKPPRAKREIILPYSDSSKDRRPIKAKARASLIRAIAKGQAWLQDLITGRIPDTGAIALSEGRSERSVQMVLSLAFLAPEIVEAAVAGKLPRGMGVTRLMDLPPVWSEQFTALGLARRD
jgi:site-specific DNA recombinase